jgi:hypothetical protein
MQGHQGRQHPAVGGGRGQDERLWRQRPAQRHTGLQVRQPVHS